MNLALIHEPRSTHDEPRSIRGARSTFPPLLRAALTAASALTALAVLAATGAQNAAGQDVGQAAYDLVIEGGWIVDGAGNAAYPGDVAVSGDRVVAITAPGMLANANADKRIDASGRIVAPGFIDIQSHSRGSFVGDGDGRVVSKVAMGVTTEIMGESTTNGPSTEAAMEAAGDAAGRTVFSTFGNWIDAMAQHGASVNFGSFVGASTIRIYGMGYRMGAAGEAELELMRSAVRESMEDGAFGIGSALIYPPGSFASTEELVAINEAAAPYGGVYITHLRSEADRLLEAMDEAIEIGVRAEVPVEIYHLKAAGRRNWHKAAMAVAKIDSARAAGIDIQANMYPYTAGSTGLTACFPPWASAENRLMERLADPQERARIRADMENPSGDWEDLCGLASPEGTLIVGLDRPENEKYVGSFLSEIAEDMGQDWIETAFDLALSERGRVGTVYFMMSEENVAMQIGQDWMKFGTDAGGWNPEGATGLTHPRAYGTFARILGKYVREEGATTLEDAVRKMTSAVATRIGIQDRGLLVPGYYADIVVFDPGTVSDHATYTEPHQLSTGVDHVFVNGVAVLENGEHTGALPGRPVRGRGWTGERGG